MGLDDTLRSYGIDPTSIPPATEEEVARVMQVLFPRSERRIASALNRCTQAPMKVLLAIFGAIGGLAVLLGLTWIFQGNDFFLTKTFAPKYEAVRRDTFEQSKAYNQGMIQELQNMQFEYAQATPDQRAALASIILHRAADYDVQRMPVDLRNFVEGLRSERSFRP